MNDHRLVINARAQMVRCTCGGFDHRLTDDDTDLNALARAHGRPPVIGPELPTCPLVDRCPHVTSLVIDLSRARGTTEAVVRLERGLTHPEDHAPRDQEDPQ